MVSYTPTGSGAGLHPRSNGGETPTGIQISQSNASLQLPGGDWVLAADFLRIGNDLVLRGIGGEEISAIGYFALPSAPDIVTETGARLPAGLVARLAGPEFPGQYAQAGTIAGGEAIGQVETLTGTATATRADGTQDHVRKSPRGPCATLRSRPDRSQRLRPRFPATPPSTSRWS